VRVCVCGLGTTRLMVSSGVAADVRQCSYQAATKPASAVTATTDRAITSSVIELVAAPDTDPKSASVVVDSAIVRLPELGLTFRYSAVVRGSGAVPLASAWKRARALAASPGPSDDTVKFTMRLPGIMLSIVTRSGAMPRSDAMSLRTASRSRVHAFASAMMRAKKEPCTTMFAVKLALDVGAGVGVVSDVVTVVVAVPLPSSGLRVAPGDNVPGACVVELGAAVDAVRVGAGSEAFGTAVVGGIVGCFAGGMFGAVVVVPRGAAVVATPLAAVVAAPGAAVVAPPGVAVVVPPGAAVVVPPGAVVVVGVCCGAPEVGALVDVEGLDVLPESTVAVDTGSFTALLCLRRCTLFVGFFARSDDRPINTRVVPKLHVLHKSAMDGKHVSSGDSRRESMSALRTTCDVRPHDTRSFNQCLMHMRFSQAVVPAPPPQLDIDRRCTARRSAAAA
jgi:hypothetical protein